MEEIQRYYTIFCPGHNTKIQILASANYTNFRLNLIHKLILLCTLLLKYHYIKSYYNLIYLFPIWVPGINGTLILFKASYNESDENIVVSLNMA
jgi:hypothetical protein